MTKMTYEIALAAARRLKTPKVNFAIWHEGASENRISHYFVVVLFSEAPNVS